jgi:DNA-binding response OmpR family regulator
MNRILVVEDDQLLSEELVRALSEAGFVCDVASNGTSGLSLALANGYDLVLLDIMLPGLNGYQVCARLRSKDWHMPILVLTAKGGEWDEAEALETGADDYLTKPFSMVVLRAHIEALIRRSRLLPAPRIEWEGMSLDRVTRTFRHGEATVELTGREMEVLARLMLAHGEPVSKEELVSTIWGDPDDVEMDCNTIVVYIKRLRNKLRKPPQPIVIETIHGIGYRLAG